LGGLKLVFVWIFFIKKKKKLTHLKFLIFDIDYLQNSKEQNTSFET